MNYLNRQGSPMLHFDTEVPLDQDTHQKIVTEFEKQSKTRSPFQIGSVDLINRRIGHLDRRLKEFTPDEVSKESLFVDDIDVRANFNMDDIVTDQQMLEKTKFAGVYSFGANFGLPNTERVKHIEKISAQKKASSFYLAAKGGAQSDKPQFVELCQFPGFNQNELTPLPCSVQPVDILVRVVEAQPVKFSSQYRSELDRCFLSGLSRAVLQDTFWYHFLEHYGQDYDKPELPRFYNRVAHNYTRLLFLCKNEHFRNAFLKSYPSLLSQALYSAYCNAFPHSYSKFQADFKEAIVCLVYKWLTGLQPRCRLWLDWNKEALEPAIIRQREELLRAESEKKDTFQLLDKALQSGSSAAAGISAGDASAASPDVPLAAQSATSMPQQQQQQQQQQLKANSGNSLQSRSRATNLSVRPPPQPVSKRESHPLGPGPQERHLVFNTHGQSPLVRHFLSRHRLLPDAGTDTLVQRLELRAPPPLDAPTYAEFVAANSAEGAANLAAYRDRRRRGEAALLGRQKRHIEHTRALDRARDALLADRSEVRRLADLILREGQRRPDDEPVGAGEAVEAALMRRGRQKGAAS